MQRQGSSFRHLADLPASTEQSPNHFSHMAYPIGGETGPCPSTHSVRVVTLFYEIMWSVHDYANVRSQGLNATQPFVLAMGDSTGFGMHGDFQNGWDGAVLQEAIDTCTSDSGVIEYCELLDLGVRLELQPSRPHADLPTSPQAKSSTSTRRATRAPRPPTLTSKSSASLRPPCPAATPSRDTDPTLRPAPRPTYRQASPTPPCTLALLREFSKAFQGNTELTPSLFTRVAQPCSTFRRPPGAPVVAGTPQVLTAYNGWDYQDCYSDLVGGTRALSHALSTPSKTVEACLDACAAAGYTKCGVQYHGECWGSNELGASSSALGYGSCGLTCNDNALQVRRGSSV